MFSKIFSNTYKNLKNINYTSKRFFDLHEYQSKDIMRKYGVRVQKGEIALNENEAFKIAQKLDPTGGLILKAQVHAGGRGKGKYFGFFPTYFRNSYQWTQGRC
jgi:succinyl-CoA synthetase beta subunit